jgi:MFS family permease
MAFLSNKSVNLANLHSMTHSMALSVAGMFFVAFLLKAGVRPHHVLLVVAATLAARMALRPLSLATIRRVGMRRTMMLGTVLNAAQFVPLGLADGLGPAVWVWALSSALADIFYWLPYHAYFACIGDAEHRGKQLGVRQALSAVCDVLGPVTGGLLVSHCGVWASLAVGATVSLAGLWPLLHLPDVDAGPPVRPRLWSPRPGANLFFADAWIAAGTVFAWQIVLFHTMNDDFTALGLVASAAGVVTVLTNLTVGKLVDRGHGMTINRLSMAVFAASLVVRVVAVDATTATVATLINAFVLCLYIPSLMAEVYNRAKASESALAFHFEAEGAWDMGGILGCLLAALVTVVAGSNAAVGVAFGGILVMAALREGLAKLAAAATDNADRG